MHMRLLTAVALLFFLASSSARPAAAGPLDGEASPEPVRPGAVEAPRDTAAEVPETKPAPASEPARLKVLSWGGAYGEAFERAVVAPYRRAHDLQIELLRYPEGARERATVAAATQKPDIVELSSGDLEKACSAGELIPIEVGALAPAPDGSPLVDDFLPGGLTRCGVGTFAWSQVLVVDKSAFSRRVPQTLKDAFNVSRFPGKRALPKEPRYLMPLAVMADGAAPEEVYRLLEEEEGVRRALAKLDALGDSIVWWDQPAEALALLQGRQAAIAAAYSGRVFYEIAAGRPYAIIWDGQIYEVNALAIPGDAPNRAAAREFVAYATDPARLSAQAQLFPYGPMRASAVRLAGKHATLGIELAPLLPTSPANMAHALKFEAQWWAVNEARLSERFALWLQLRRPQPPKQEAAGGRERRKSRRRSRN